VNTSHETELTARSDKARIVTLIVLNLVPFAHKRQTEALRSQSASLNDKKRSPDNGWRICGELTPT
jgi:hypothetical protein